MPQGKHSVDIAGSKTAIASWLGFEPSGSSARLGWAKSAVHTWRGRVAKTSFGTLDQPMMVFHTGGAQSVPVQFGHRWAESNSCPGSVTIVPPGTPLTWHVDGEVHSHTVHLGLSCFDKLVDANMAGLLARMRFHCGRHDPVLTSLIGALVAETDAPTEIGPLYVDAISDSLALHLIRVATERGAQMLQHDPRFGGGRAGGLSARALRRAIEQIDVHLEQGIALQALAEAAGLSRAHFARAFRRSTGLSPHRFLTARRIERARERLAADAGPIAEIALQCGFSSQAHFTEYFHRVTGQTPNAYRRARR